MKNESVLQRGWADFQKAVTSFWGALFYLLATTFVGLYTGSFWFPVIFVIGTLLLIWLISTVTAPYRQRNHERREREALNQQVVALQRELSGTSKPRQLNREQVSVLADAIKSAGVLPETLNVIYAPTAGEAAEFAADIGDAIKHAGIKCTVHNGGLYNHDPRARGVKIVRDRQNSSLVALGDAIHSQLKSFGLNPSREDWDRKDTIHIYVARRAE